MESIQLDGVFTVGEAEEACELARSRWSRAKDVSAIYVLWAMILVPLTIAGWQAFSGVRGTLMLAGIVAAILALAGLLATVAKKKMDSRRLESMRTARQGLFVPVTWTLSHDGVKAVSDSGTANVKWDSFRGYRVGTDTVILFQKQPAKNYNIVGRSQADNNDVWNGAIELISNKLDLV